MGFRNGSSRKTTGQACIVALILHGMILLVLGAYIAYTQSPQIQEFVASTFLKPQKTEKPKERPKEFKPIVRPTIPTEQPVPVQDVQVVPRVTTAAVVRAPRVTASTVLEFSATPVRHDVRIAPNVPKVKVMLKQQRFMLRPIILILNSLNSGEL